MLKPEAVQNLGLALHELAANAEKYGSLSDAAGPGPHPVAVLRGGLQVEARLGGEGRPAGDAAGAARASAGP